MTDHLLTRLAEVRAEARTEMAAVEAKFSALHFLIGYYGHAAERDPSNAELAELVDKMRRVLDGTLAYATLAGDPVGVSDVVEAEVVPCCDLHRPGSCCDPNDCGQCCENCPDPCPGVTR